MIMSSGCGLADVPRVVVHVCVVSILGLTMVASICVVSLNDSVSFDWCTMANAAAAAATAAATLGGRGLGRMLRTACPTWYKLERVSCFCVLSNGGRLW